MPAVLDDLWEQIASEQEDWSQPAPVNDDLWEQIAREEAARETFRAPTAEELALAESS